MSYRPVVFLIVSVIAGLTLLATLLLVATSPVPERVQQTREEMQYLSQGISTVDQAVNANVAVAQLKEFDAQLEFVDGALLTANEVMQNTRSSAYEESGLLHQIRWLGAQAINWQDQDVPTLSGKHETSVLATTIGTDIERVSDQLVNYREGLQDYVSLHEDYSQALNKLLADLRQVGDEASADAIYLTGDKIEVLLAKGDPQSLDGVVQLIGDLESRQRKLTGPRLESLRGLIDQLFLLTGIKRQMADAVRQMRLASLSGNLTSLTVLLEQDAMYFSAAVSDARILLNVSTVLLLILLAFSGLRLQLSYRALGASHDDLEVRVQERTVDLERANDDLKESQVQLVQAEKMSSLGQLVAGVMHEINTPLLYVLNNTTTTAANVDDLAEFLRLSVPLLVVKDNGELKDAVANLMARRADFDAEELFESLSEVQSLADDSVEGLNQISELVQSLKDFSRLDRVADDKFDVTSGIEKTLVITKNMLKQGVKVERNFDDLPEIYCSPSRINQVFINLVTNAVQAMDGQGTLTIATKHLPSAEGDSVEVSFEDTGCGIEQEYLDKVMDPFFTTKPVGQGTGLGLSIVRQIVDQHGGQVFIDSEVGRGTRITLNFPVRPNLDEEEAA